MKNFEYFCSRLLRWEEFGGDCIELPVTDEFGTDLYLINELVKFIQKPEVMPATYQLMFRLIRLADYTGCDAFLKEAAARLGTTVATINN